MNISLTNESKNEAHRFVFLRCPCRILPPPPLFHISHTSFLKIDAIQIIKVIRNNDNIAKTCRSLFVISFYVKQDYSNFRQ